MKRILSFLAILLFLASFTTPVLAQGPTVTQKEKVLNSNEIVNKDYFAASDYVAVHGTINGDAYLAGGNILVDGTVNGDIIAAGGTIVIEAKGVKNIRVFGGTILINSKEVTGNITAGGGQIDITETSLIMGSLVAGGGSLRIGGPIERGAHIAGGQVLISNDIGGDVFAGGEKIRVSQNAKINGNFTYWSKNKVEVGDSAQISGTTTQKTPPNVDKFRDGGKAAFTSAKIVKIIIDVVATIVLGIIFIYLFPIYTTKVVKSLNSNFLKNLGVGFLATILTPILFIVLIITIVGIPFSILLLIAYLFLAYISKIFISLIIGEKIFKYLKTKKISTGWMFIVGLFAYTLISLIPIIGGILVAFATLLGLGALLVSKKDYYLLLREKKII